MKFLKWFFSVLILLIAFFYWQFYTRVSNSSQPVFFEIKQKEAFQNVVSRLKENKLVRNEFLFKTYGRILGLDTEIKAGRFRIESRFTPAQILDFLANPQNGELSVTIPEGYSIFDIDKKLASLNLIRGGDFVAWVFTADLKENFFKESVEGYLFPDTYFVFAKDFEPKYLVDLMLKNFERKVENILKEDLLKIEKEHREKRLKEIIIMASILEKEVRTKKDYQIVAGILWKRLKHDWPLQTDATLLYGKKDRSLSREDLRKDAPYNTYTRKGLPPTPIGNPGIETIKAAFYPVESPYWFYLTDKDGNVIYAKTNEEHEENKRKYL